MSAGPKDTDLLKQPFGTLVAEKDITKQKILSMLEGAKKIIAVGDATTERLISFNITPDIAVIDGATAQLSIMPNRCYAKILQAQFRRKRYMFCKARWKLLLALR
jgi:uncharacterized protein (UPF0218 family)